VQAGAVGKIVPGVAETVLIGAAGEELQDVLEIISKRKEVRVLRILFFGWDNHWLSVIIY
jgi:hypothetical protein